MKTFIIPILTSIFVGVFLFHYKDIFEEPKKVYFVERSKRIISMADRHITASVFSIHNETPAAISDISIHGSATNSIDGLSIATESNRAKIFKSQVQAGEDEFSISVPKLKADDVIYLDIVVETAAFSEVDYKFSDADRVIPQADAHTFSYGTRKQMLISAAIIFILAYFAILLSVFLRWQRTIFPGFFREGSEAGFALLHSGANELAKEWTCHALVPPQVLV